MKRRWVYLKDIEPFDSLHTEEQNEYGFTAHETKDDEADTLRHEEGIEYVKGILEKGQKVMPILIGCHSPDDPYERLDGFKRYMAHKRLGKEIIECFICDKTDLDERRVYQYMGKPLTCCKGGQSYEIFPLFEGEENENPEDIRFLYNSPTFRIEVRENIHIHWGETGKNRLELGLKDFMDLADTFEKYV